MNRCLGFCFIQNIWVKVGLGNKYEAVIVNHVKYIFSSADLSVQLSFCRCLSSVHNLKFSSSSLKLKPLARSSPNLVGIYLGWVSTKFVQMVTVQWLFWIFMNCFNFLGKSVKIFFSESAWPIASKFGTHKLNTNGLKIISRRVWL